MQASCRPHEAWRAGGARDLPVVASPWEARTAASAWERVAVVSLRRRGLLRLGLSWPCPSLGVESRFSRLVTSG